MKTSSLSGFTLVEVMMVVAVIGLMACIAIPSYQMAREKSRENVCFTNQRNIEAAKEQWALETGHAEGDAVAWADILPYLRNQPVCPAGGIYTLENVGTGCYCAIHDWRTIPEYNWFQP